MSTSVFVVEHPLTSKLEQKSTYKSRTNVRNPNKDGELTEKELRELKEAQRKMILDLTKIQIQHTPQVVIQAVRYNGIME